MAYTIWTVTLASSLLLPWGRSARAADASAGGEIRFVNIDNLGPTQGRVREYDGRQRDGFETDLWLRSAFGNTLLDLGAKDLNSGNDGAYANSTWRHLNSGNESAYLDLNVGSPLRLQGDLGILTHRQPVVLHGIIINDVYLNAADATPEYASVNYFLNRFYGPEDLLFKRTESQAKLSLRCPTHPASLSLKYWREGERGAQPFAYYNGNQYVTRQDLDRYTRDITGTIESGVGEGHVAYEFMTRKFAENAPTAVDSTDAGSNGIMLEKYLNIISDQSVRKHSLSGTYRLRPNLKVAGGLSSRTRERHETHYKMRANSAHAAVAYKPAKDLSITGRAYGRATKTEENEGHPMYLYDFPAGTNAGVDSLDFYSYKGDLKISYTGIKHVAFKAGYKPSHTYRRNAGLHSERETFANAITYQDGVSHPAYTIENPTEAKDTRHAVSAGVDFSLPADAQLELEAEWLTANRSAYQFMSTSENEQNATLTVPFGQRTHFFASGGTLLSKNDKASFAKFRKRLSRILFGLMWMDKKDRGSAGLNCSFEDGEEIFDVFYDEKDPAAGSEGQIHLAMPYQYKNHVISGNGTVNLPWNTSLSADASYIESKGDNLTLGVFNPYLTPAVTAANLYPTDVRIIHWGVSAAYEAIKNVTARLGYNQSVWLDAYDGGANNGRAHVASFDLSAKF
ncbi:MAG: hypothetical protein ABII00_02565 [Elusimicrobiota bacterium]